MLNSNMLDSLLAFEGETVADVVENVDTMSTAINGVTDSLVQGFTSLNTSLVVGVGSIIGVAVVLFGIKFAPRFLKGLFKAIAA